MEIKTVRLLCYITHSQKSGKASGIHPGRIIRLNQNGGQFEEKSDQGLL